VTEREAPAKEEKAPSGHKDRRGSRVSASNRRILAGLFWLLASLGILVSTVLVWAHQSLLTTAGWSGLVREVFDDPAVVQGASEALVQKVSVAIDLPALVAQILPGERELVANVVTTRTEDFLASRLATALQREDVRGALANVNTAAHAAALTAIRGGGEILGTQQGTISLDVFPLIETVLVGLQEAGIIDASREIPDLSEYQPAEENVARIEAVLGRELPEDIGTIQLVTSERLATVQQLVRTFDLLTIASVVVTLVLIVLAVLLSLRRLRMIVWLALGAVGALALGRAFTRLVVEDISGSLAQGGTGVTVRAAIEAAVDQVMWVSFIVIAAAVLVAGVAMWLDHRQPRRQAGALPPPPRTMGDRIRERQRELAIAGIAVIAFFVIWRVGGPDVALLAAAATGIWLVGLSVVTRRVDRIDPSTGLPGDPWIR
jgi:hypothetical protein